MSTGASQPDSTLPLILAGPILRRVTADEVLLWLATSEPVEFCATLTPEGQQAQILTTDNGLTSHCFAAGEQLHIYLLTLQPGDELPRGCRIAYDLTLSQDNAQHSLCQLLDGLCYDGYDSPGFVLKPRIHRLLHGSCRKPHFLPDESAEDGDAGDGLERADRFLQDQDTPDDWPSLLLLTGDQIYADDVAGPMLYAIHQLSARLGLPDEPLEGTDLRDSRALRDDEPNYYNRDQILPRSKLAGELRDQFFSGARKPIFTSANAKNHLMSLAEMFAMYLLVWSPDCWQDIDLSRPESITDPEQQQRYDRELESLKHFRRYLSGARRVMAHLPVAMIFDDHDVTDDWNLTAAWEKAAYEHPLSRRVIGNAVISYLLFQGWGNAPENFPDELLDRVRDVLDEPGTKKHDTLIDELIRFNNWHYEWQTDPILIVLDTRTNRWRSERDLNNPSGLMDWESLTDLQQTLIDHRAVIMVSAAPVFGVKLIESIQRMFTWFGKPLLVDAENWMAHPGAAYALMNLFKHKRTPHNFVILSGDVHYSFVYDIELRGHQDSPNIWQITSSGIRNEFPPKLLDIFDRLNRWLYAPWSPLNWLTKRRDMRVSPRKPEHASRGERLLNAAGIGLVELDGEGAPTRVIQLCATRDDVEFEFDEKQARWE